MSTLTSPPWTRTSPQPTIIPRTQQHRETTGERQANYRCRSRLNFLSKVLRKSQQDDRFRAAATVWRKLTANWIQILADDTTPELTAVVQRVSGFPMDERRKHPKDLGETMVIAHAVVAAESGQSVIILMDDGPGARIATLEISRLQRLVSSGHPVGSITLASTLTILGRAAGSAHLPDRAAVRDTYNRLRGLDDGLPPIENTDLLSPKFWA